MKGRVLISGLMVLLVLPLFSCGGGGAGAPGSSNSSDTGILIQSVLLSVDSNDIDVVSMLGCGTAPNFTQESDLTDSLATMKITAVPDPPLGTPFPANIESCYVTYASAVPDAPIIESTTIYPNCSFSEGETSCSVDLLNIARKDQWWLDVGANLPWDYPTRYTVKYDCKYQNSFRKTGHLGGRIDIDLANWRVCGG